MIRDLSFFKVDAKLNTKCLQICEKLDNLPPYSMNFVFVSTYYSDHETALDFLSRLGNFSSLEGYAHYFKYQTQESIEYIKTLKGIVYD